MSGRVRISMRTVMISTTVAIVAAAVLAVGTVAERNTRRALTNEAEARLLLEARNLALASAGALLSDLPELTLHPVVRELAESRPELAFAVVTDHRGVVQGHKDARSLGGAWQMPGGLSPTATGVRLRADEALLGSRGLLVASVPVASVTGQRLGHVVVGLRRAYVEREVAAARRQQTLVVLLVLAAGVGVAFLLLTALLRPIGALRSGLERIGRGDLDTPIALRDRTELGLLAETVDGMAAQLKVAQREIVEKERLAHEVELARDIQQRLLPEGAHVRGDFTLRGAHRAAAEVGGDYFDVLTLPDGRLAVAIADVAGKGLGGCLVMSMLSASLRALRSSYASPSALLVALEEQLVQTLRPGEFVTMFYGVLDPSSGAFAFASAGHTPLLVWRADRREAEWHSTRGIPLGAMRGGMLRGTLDDHRITIQPGDLLFQFTDGYNEAPDASGEQFGFERIAKLVSERAEDGPDAVVAALSGALVKWSGGRPIEDDQTVLAVARAPRAAGQAIEAPSLESADPEERLAVAASRGHALSLPPALEALDGLGAWLAGLPDLGALAPDERLVIETSLYELCANVVEHGSTGTGDERLDLWWVPAEAAGSQASPAPTAATNGDAASRVRDGFFALRDRGYPFRPGRRRPFDTGSHPAWRKGRGLGLDIVHLAVREVVFRPGTPSGNVTLLSFDPAKARPQRKEQSHG